ncbi:MAG: mechanosensitive ion channel [Betaproteobacteria bacterium]|nr:mechanosensitive ion channel [Betaproteobacteria bacterium]
MEGLSALGVSMGDLGHGNVLWQAGVIGASLCMAWLVSRVLHGRLQVNTVSATARFGLAGVHRVLFPVVGVALLAIGRYALNKAGYLTPLLNLAIPLTGSWAVIRALVYVLRTAFDEAPWLVFSERALAWTVWVGVALHLSGVLPDILAGLDAINVQLSGSRISLLTVLQAIVVVAAAIVLGLWAGRLIEMRLMKASQVDMNLRVVLSRLIRVLLMVLAVLIALPALGIDITVLSVFGGALGVGIGFGLQKIASNYVSGFTILLDRSITPGAMVTIENFYGQVTRVASRYIVVRGLDGTEAIVPNETVVTSIVINHSFSDPQLELPIQIGYRSEVEKAIALMEQAAATVQAVLAQPAPKAILEAFGDSGINLKLFLWTNVPETAKAVVQSDVYRAILKAFAASGIEIPYPQREVRLLASPGATSMPSESP